MQKRFLLPLIITFVIPFTMKAEWIPLNKQSASPTPPNVTLISDDDNSTVLKIEISGFEQKNFFSEGKNYQMIDLLSESFTNSPGYPELPYIAKVLAIPDQAGVSVEVLETGEIQTFNNLYLPPARESWFEGSPETLYNEKTEAYNSMGFYPDEFVQLDPPSVFRDFRIARVSVFPIRYIAAKKEFQIVSSITVRVNYGPGEVVNPKTITKKPIAPSFGKLYSQLIFNYQSVLNKNYGGKESGHELMLCIMPDEFVASFQTYADWKRQSGIDIHITKFTDIGANSTNPVIIKNHITDAYHNWVVPPTYVLIVGDNNVFPKQTVTLDGWTFPNEDYFVEIDGNDYFPELMIGRFTNESDYGMQVMINKFLKYEKTPYTTNTDWFKKGICCSNNAYPSQAETKRFTAAIMLQDGGFISVDTMMSDNPCTYHIADVVAAINSGRSWLNYRGEGWYYGWDASCTPLDITDLTSINNGQKFTFVTSIGCGVAMFDETYTSTHNSFGEDWIEQGTLSSPKGAVAFIGPTSNTHTAYNNKIDRGIYIGMFQEGLETPGQALLRGKLYMYNVFGNDYYAGYHYKIYCVLGDPSIHIWKDVPQAITVTYPASSPLGITLLNLQLLILPPVYRFPMRRYAYPVLLFSQPALLMPLARHILTCFLKLQETLKVTVRGGNVIPFLGTLSVVQPTGPYVIRETYSMNDISGGNGNGLLDYGESILMSLSVKNVGTQQANNVNVTLSTTDPYITITDNVHNYGNIAAGQIISATNAFAFNVANNFPDAHIVLFNVAATSGTSTWNSYFSTIGNAPILSMGTVTISDPSGNNNGRLDPGETATITAVVNNSGHCSSPSASATLSSSSPYITINTGSSVLGQIASGGSANAVFSITCSPSTPIGQSVDLAMNVAAGSYSFSHTHYTSVGLILEDWELGNFTRFPWTLSGNTNWAVVNTGQYEGLYTARSGVIEDNQTSEMSLTMQVNTSGTVSFYRKTSSEGNYDFLRFYIDNVQQGQWSGLTDWSQVSYVVNVGIHTFKWTYSKDYTVAANDDCAWVDYIIFPSSTVLAPEISVNPSSFSKLVMPGGSVNDVLNIANSGNVALNFVADYPLNVAQAIVYPLAINYWTGSCTSTTITQFSAVKAVPPSEAGWMKFDVSSIPIGAVINSVEFHGYIYDNYIPHWSITPVSVDPLTASPSLLYPDIIAEANSGYYLFRTETATLSLGWKTYMLGGNVNTNLAAALAQGWFAIGVMDRDASVNNIKFNGCIATNKPYLVINYSYPPPPTWLKINGGTSVAGSVAAGNNQNINVSFEAGSYTVGTYQANIKITSNDPDEAQIMIPCTMIISSGLNVSVKAVLEGPFNVSAMGTGINAILPLSQPYNAAPWNYTGTESVAAMPATVVDWVLVELRDATSAANATLATRIARKAGLLLTNGNIVATDGASPLFFTNSLSNGLFLVIYHRNHLAILSSNALTQSGGVYTYDYTTSSGQAYGASSQKQLATGIWGMISGDVNANGSIGNEDITPPWKSNAGKTGYYPTDLNFDRHVNNRDKDSYWYPNNGKGTNVPQ